MNVLVLSDLHICNGRHISVFGWDSEELIRKIEMYRSEYRVEKVILNGDIFELYKYNMKQIADAHKDLIDYLRELGCIFIRGNHDSLYEDALDSYDMVNSGGKIIHFEHGHKADTCGYTIIRALHRLLFKVLKYSGVLDIAHAVALRRTHLNLGFDPERSSRYRYRKYAERLLAGSYDVIVMGHTHILERLLIEQEDSSKLYLNSGTCSQGRFQGLVLDTETLDYIFLEDMCGELSERAACRAVNSPA